MEYSNRLKAGFGLTMGAAGLMMSATLIVPQAARAVPIGDASGIAAPNTPQFSIAPNTISPDGQTLYRRGQAQLDAVIDMEILSPETQSSIRSLDLLAGSYQPADLQQAGDAVVAQFAGSPQLPEFVAALQAAMKSSQQLSDALQAFVTDDGQVAIGQLFPILTLAQQQQQNLLNLLNALNALPKNGTPEQNAAIAAAFNAIASATTTLEQVLPPLDQLNSEMDTWR